MFGLFAGICSTVGSLCSAVVSTVSSSIGGIVSTFGKLLPTIGQIVTGIQLVVKIADVIVKVADYFGILDDSAKLDEIGAKQMQEGTRPQMENESAEDYLNYLTNEVTLDEKNFEESTPEDKYVQNAVGLGIVSQAISEKVGVNIDTDFLIAIEKLKFQSSQVISLLKNLGNNDIGSTEKFVGYLKNELTNSETTSTGKAIKDSLSELNPQLSNEEIQKEIVKMKEDFNEKTNY